MQSVVLNLLQYHKPQLSQTTKQQRDGDYEKKAAHRTGSAIITDQFMSSNDWFRSFYLCFCFVYCYSVCTVA